jgi:hypothetical protein
MMLNNSIDALYFAYRQPKATQIVIRDFLKCYPTAKVSLFLDEGGFAPELDSESESQTTITKSRGRISASKGGLYLSVFTVKRFLEALTQASNKDADKLWLFILEDDVKIFSRINELQYDLNGVNINERLVLRIRVALFLMGYRGSKYLNIGGFGGSVVRKSILGSHTKEEWARKLWPIIFLSGRPLGSDEVITIMNFMVGGTAGNYTGLFETWQTGIEEAIKLGQVVTLHKYKEHYE